MLLIWTGLIFWTGLWTVNLQHGVDRRGRGAVEGGEGDAVVAAVLEQLEDVVAGQDAGGDDAVETHGGGGVAGRTVSHDKCREEGKMEEDRRASDATVGGELVLSK